MGTAPQPTHLKFPRVLAELEITVRPDHIGVSLWGARDGGLHPLLLQAGAAPTDCWRTLSTYPGDPLPERLFLNGTLVGLSRQEADALDTALRSTAPSCLREREAA